MMTEPNARLASALADRYRLERELGQGGMATVYLAADLKHDRKVAVKVLKPELAAVLGAERFVVEIKTTAALQHPHILPLFDSGTADGFLFYVMPFIQGETLRSKLDRETQLGIDEAVRLTTAVADALDYAHRQGVIHRDIKPENILLHDGRPMVADFGIALAVSAAAGGRMTETGLSLGTPHYMSPEQATGEREITGRSDVYSLGSVLYEMLTGSPPHTGASAQQIIMKIVTEEAQPVTKLRKSVPPNVAAAVARAVEKLPADRFESAAAFRQALENPAFAGDGTTLISATSARAVGGVSRRVLGGVVAVAALLLVAAIWGWARRAPVPGPERLKVILRPGEFPPGVLGRHVALSPDGRTIVYIDTIGGSQLWMKTEDRAEGTLLTGAAGGVAPRFSRDGQWVAFSVDRKVKKVPRVGGSPVTVGDSVSNLLAWLDDGTIVYRGTPESSTMLRAVSADGAPLRQWHDSLFPGEVVNHLDGLPGGHDVLVSICRNRCESSRLVVLDVVSGAMTPLMGDVLSAWAIAEDRVLFVRKGGTVFLGAYDARKRRFRSPPVPVLEGVRISGLPDLVAARDGTLLYITGAADDGGQSFEAVWVTRNGTASLVDSSWQWKQPPNGNGLTLAPDGRHVALNIREPGRGSSDVWVKQLERGPLTRLTFEGATSRPVWSADGRHLWYVSRDSTGVNLRRRRADGTASPEVVLDATGDMEEIVSTPDTMVMIVRMSDAGGRRIFLFRRNAGTGDSALTPLLAAKTYDQVSPALSPDGRWLAYTSTESGRDEVYVRPFPDVEAGRWQISRDGGSEPVWSHTGRELFFRSETPRTVVSVPVLPGPAFATGDQKVLFEDRFFRQRLHVQYAVTPDDQRFLFRRRVQRDETPDATVDPGVMLVRHWLAELDLRGNTQ
jgi:serine/threonine-protein kinase